MGAAVTLEIVGMDAFHPVLGGAEVLGGKPEHLSHAIGVVDLSARYVPVVDAFVDGPHRDVVALFARPQGVLGVLEVGDVADRAHHAHRTPLGVALRHAVLPCPAPFALARAIAVIDLEARRLALYVRRECCQIRLQVIGVD